jgi:hypothetical protein
MPPRAGRAPHSRQHHSLRGAHRGRAQPRRACQPAPVQAHLSHRLSRCHAVTFGSCPALAHHLGASACRPLPRRGAMAAATPPHEFLCPITLCIMHEPVTTVRALRSAARCLRLGTRAAAARGGCVCGARHAAIRVAQPRSTLARGATRIRRGRDASASGLHLSPSAKSALPPRCRTPHRPDRRFSGRPLTPNPRCRAALLLHFAPPSPRRPPALASPACACAGGRAHLRERGNPHLVRVQRAQAALPAVAPHWPAAAQHALGAQC